MEKMKCRHEREITIDGQRFYACMKFQDFSEWECSYGKSCYDVIWVDEDEE